MGTDVLIMVGVDVTKRPISIIPTMAKMNKAKMVLIKEMIEPDDKAIPTVIYGKPDLVFEMLMAKLEIEIPEYDPEVLKAESL